MGSGTVGSTSSKSSSKFRQTQAGGASEASRVRGGSRIHWGAHTHWQVCQQPSQSFSGKVQGPGAHDGRSRHGPEKNILKLPRRTYLCRSRLHKGGRKYTCKGLPLDPDQCMGSTWGSNRHFQGGRLGKVNSNLRLQSPWTISLHREGPTCQDSKVIQRNLLSGITRRSHLE